MSSLTLTNRADLMKLPGFAGLNVDSDGNPCVWSNQYVCDDDGAFPDDWSCQCDSECPDCGSDYSPVESVWIGPKDRISKGLWGTLPEAGDKNARPATIPVVIDGDKVTIGIGFAVIGPKDAPAVVVAGSWPDFDAFMRSEFPHMDARATVYYVDAGKPKFPTLRAAVISDGNIVAGTEVKVITPLNKLIEFCDSWNAKNIFEDEPSSPGPGF
ncbi:hypothetical protein ACEUZ9_001096 [Paracoccus litorisediminis]|uniref:hypothetical protein n=1 Tax=Paracoccus litorisediminis TaxID=2006130 RepID=UPI0037305D54